MINNIQPDIIKTKDYNTAMNSFITHMNQNCNKDGYYRFNCDGDCNILIDSIEYIGIDCYVEDKKLNLDNGDWLSDSEEVYCVDGMEYIRIENN